MNRFNPQKQEVTGHIQPGAVVTSGYTATGDHHNKRQSRAEFNVTNYRVSATAATTEAVRGEITSQTATTRTTKHYFAELYSYMDHLILLRVGRQNIRRFNLLLP